MEHFWTLSRSGPISLSQLSHQFVLMPVQNRTIRHRNNKQTVQYFRCFLVDFRVVDFEKIGLGVSIESW